MVSLPPLIFLAHHLLATSTSFPIMLHHEAVSVATAQEVARNC